MTVEDLRPVDLLPTRTPVTGFPERRGTGAPPIFDVTLHVLGVQAHLTVVSPDASVIDDARARLRQLDRLWDADDPTGDMARLLREPCRSVPVSSDTLLLLSLAFDAGLLAEADIELPAGTARAPGLLVARHGCEDLSPSGLCALGHALAADLVVADLLEAGVTTARVAVGAAVRVEGRGPRRDGWFVPVTHPAGHFSPACLRLDSGAVGSAAAASPRSGVRAAVVVSTHAWHAHVLARSVLGRSSADAAGRIEDTSTGALLMADGEQRPVGSWREHLA